MENVRAFQLALSSLSWKSLSDQTLFYLGLEVGPVSLVPAGGFGIDR